MKPIAFLLLLFVLVTGYASAQGTQKTGPCANAQTQAQLNVCWGKEYKAADATLNQVYRQLVAMLDNKDKAKLRNVESAWVTYRDANCNFVANQYKGGSIFPMIRAICLGDMTKNRTAELRSQIKDRNH